MIAIILISGVQGVTQSRIDMLYGLSLLAGVNMGVAVIEAIVTGYSYHIRKSQTDCFGGRGPCLRQTTKRSNDLLCVNPCLFSLEHSCICDRAIWH